MKVKKDIDLEILLEYGFQKINKEEAHDNENWTISYYDYLYDIGHARRGQFYYLLIGESSRRVVVFASKPDRDGTSIALPDVLLRLIADGIIGTEPKGTSND